MRKRNSDPEAARYRQHFLVFASRTWLVNFFVHQDWQTRWLQTFFYLPGGKSHVLSGCDVHDARKGNSRIAITNPTGNSRWTIFHGWAIDLHCTVTYRMYIDMKIWWNFNYRGKRIAVMWNIGEMINETSSGLAGENRKCDVQNVAEYIIQFFFFLHHHFA